MPMLQQLPTTGHVSMSAPGTPLLERPPALGERRLPVRPEGHDTEITDEQFENRFEGDTAGGEVRPAADHRRRRELRRADMQMWGLLGALPVRVPVEQGITSVMSSVTT